MKRITLTPSEFYTFKTLANQIKLFFTHFVSQGHVIVDADEQILNGLGY
jgi:hypothetical protein